MRGTVGLFQEYTEKCVGGEQDSGCDGVILAAIVMLKIKIGRRNDRITLLLF